LTLTPNEQCADQHIAPTGANCELTQTPSQEGFPGDTTEEKTVDACVRDRRTRD